MLEASELPRNPDQLFTAQKPVDAAGDKIERRLILHDRAILNERSVAHRYKTCRIDLHASVCASAFFNLKQQL